MAKAKPSLPQVLSDFQHLHKTCVCIGNKCNRRGCTITLPQEARCLDCDKCCCFAGGTGKKPDFIVLYDRQTPLEPLWFVVEMKSHAGHVSDLVQQLQAGADMIHSDSRFAFPEAPRRLQPVVLHEKGIHVADHQVLSSKRIKFAGKAWPIKVARCPQTLTALI